MFSFRYLFVCMSFICINAQAESGTIYNEPNDPRPLAEGACKMDHGELISDFVQQEFKKLKRSGQAGMDDKFNGTTAYRQLSPLDNGDTLYRMDLYGRTPADQAIPPIDENDHPDGTRDYRCFGNLKVTSSCEVMTVPLDFMENGKLERLGRKAVEKLRKEARRNGEKLKVDKEGRIGVQVDVPTEEGFTCNRPMAFIGS